MPALVDLTAAPYHLDADQLAWVEDTLASMTLDEQVGQLFSAQVARVLEPLPQDALRGLVEEQQHALVVHQQEGHRQVARPLPKKDQFNRLLCHRAALWDGKRPRDRAPTALFRGPIHTRRPTGACGAEA